MKKSTMMTTTAAAIALVLSAAIMPVKAGEGCEFVNEVHTSLNQCLKTNDKTVCTNAGNKFVQFTLESRNKIFAVSLMSEAKNNLVCDYQLQQIITFSKSMNEK